MIEAKDKELDEYRRRIAQFNEKDGDEPSNVRMVSASSNAMLKYFLDLQREMKALEESQSARDTETDDEYHYDEESSESEAEVEAEDANALRRIESGLSKKLGASESKRGGFCSVLRCLSCAVTDKEKEADTARLLEEYLKTHVRTEMRRHERDREQRRRKKRRNVRNEKVKVHPIHISV